MKTNIEGGESTQITRNCRQYFGSRAIVNEESTDPVLVCPSTFDFHLASGSPAIGKAVTLPDVPNDFNSVIRSNLPSIGAYEYLSKP